MFVEMAEVAHQRMLILPCSFSSRTILLNEFLALIFAVSHGYIYVVLERLT